MTLKSILIKMWNNAAEDSVKKICTLQEKGESKKIICLGCHKGDIALSAAWRIGTNDIYGIDIQPKFLKEASAKGINVIAADLNKKFPIKDNSFDVVVSDQVIEHLTNVDNFVKEMFRILKPEGYAVISTENLSSWNNLFALLFGYGPPSLTYSAEKRIEGGPLSPHHGENSTLEYPRHVYIFTYQALKEIFSVHGFSVERLIGGGYYPCPEFLMKIMSKIDPRHSQFLIIKVRKEYKGGKNAQIET